MDLEHEALTPGGAAATVLVVDDERNLLELVESYLRAEGCTVLVAEDGRQALHLARTARPDVLVLDVLLPGLSGVEVCRQLRQSSDVYVLMLTARSEEADKLVGLAVGADDYLTKPFSPRELAARVKVLLRRPRGVAPLPADSEPPPLAFGDLVICRPRHAVSRRGAALHLTPHEYALLVLLAEYPGQIFTRRQLLARIWGDEGYEAHLVDVHMNNLRKKLEEDPAHPRYIETVRGVGYSFRRMPPSAGGRD